MERYTLLCTIFWIFRNFRAFLQPVSNGERRKNYPKNRAEQSLSYFTFPHRKFSATLLLLYNLHTLIESNKSYKTYLVIILKKTLNSFLSL